MAPLVSLRQARLGFGGRPLFTGLALSLGRGEKVCLVGRNGAGKSTLLKTLAGLIDLDDGEFYIEPGAKIAYLAQDVRPKADETARDFVRADGAAAHEAESWLGQLAIDPDLILVNASGGEQRRAALARALAGEPDLLLLDEPTNHLDMATIEWLEDQLKSTRAGVLVISHDRRFLGNLSRRTFWLDQGRLRMLDIGYSGFEGRMDEILQAEAAETAKLDKKIAAEAEWAVKGITARRARNEGRLRNLAKMRAERQDRSRSDGAAALALDSGARGGTLVVEAKSVCKSFGDRPIVTNFSTRILRGDRIGVIGPNGAGKSTLIKLLTGQIEPDSGSVRLGTGLEIAYFDQGRARLDPNQTLWQALTDASIGGGGDQIMVRGQPKHVVGYLKDFLFEERQVRAPVGSLSGGERARLILAKLFATPSNLLVLDEPTNDLDIDTLDLLQEVLSDYDGTVLLVSHDRDFLDRLVTSTIAMEGDGRAMEYAGGYSDYLSQRAQEGRGGPGRMTAAKPQPAPKPDKSAAPKPAASRGRLSYNQQRQLEQLPGQIDRLHAEMTALETKLADAGLFQSDPKSFQAAVARLAQARAELAAAEEHWLDLEMLREELSGA